MKKLPTNYTSNEMEFYQKNCIDILISLLEVKKTTNIKQAEVLLTRILNKYCITGQLQVTQLNLFKLQRKHFSVVTFSSQFMRFRGRELRHGIKSSRVTKNVNCILTFDFNCNFYRSTFKNCGEKNLQSPNIPLGSKAVERVAEK